MCIKINSCIQYLGIWAQINANVTNDDDSKMASNTKVGTTVEDKINEFFTQNQKFFAACDINGKRAFLLLECTPVGLWSHLRSRWQKLVHRLRSRRGL
jgi:hypothetical protein